MVDLPRALHGHNTGRFVIIVQISLAHCLESGKTVCSSVQWIKFGNTRIFVARGSGHHGLGYPGLELHSYIP